METKNHNTFPKVAASNLYFLVGQTEEATALVKKYHYSHRVPSSIVLAGTFHEAGGLFGNFGPAIAAVIFSIPPTRWSEKVLELSRLVRKDGCCIPLSRLISLACGQLKKQGIDLLVSFADAGFGHHGGIYQACSWNYDGQRNPSCDGCIVDGIFVPGRSCNSKWGTRSPTKLSELLKKPVQPHYDIGKHLYWKTLSRKGEEKAKRLGLKKIPYPKPEQEQTKSNKCSSKTICSPIGEHKQLVR